MDPDLMAEYAMRGALGRDSQFTDGMSVAVKISCGKALFKKELGLYKWDGTKRSFPAEGFDDVDEFVVNAYMGVSFKSITVKAKRGAEEVVLLREEHVEPQKTYKAKKKVDDKEYLVILKTEE